MGDFYYPCARRTEKESSEMPDQTVTTATDTTVTLAGVMPAAPVTETVTNTPTVEELLKENAELKRHATNKEEEAARVQKKNAEYEKQEQARIDAALSKEQLAQKRAAEAIALAEQNKINAENKSAEIAAKANEKLLKAAVLLKAKDMGFEHPEDAFQLADKKGITSNDDGDFDEAKIEAALKPLTGRLPVKSNGDGKGTGKFPNPLKKEITQKKGRTFNRPF